MATNNVNDFTNPVSVNTGGTGVSSTTAYAVQCGGTTTTAPIQSVASVGTAGQILTSNGAATLPSFQGSAGSGGPLVLIQKQTPSSRSFANTDFTTGITSAYNTYMMIISSVTVNNIIGFYASNDGGSTFISLTGCRTASVVGGGFGTPQEYTNCSINAPFCYISTDDIGGATYDTPSVIIWLYNVASGNNFAMTCFNAGVYSNIGPGFTFLSNQSASTNINAFRIRTYAASGGAISLFGLIE